MKGSDWLRQALKERRAAAAGVRGNPNRRTEDQKAWLAEVSRKYDLWADSPRDDYGFEKLESVLGRPMTVEERERFVLNDLRSYL